ncbi:MAG: protein phosphatase 2C domain-containing protein [Thermomicrobiales bacterium]|nr:protein phosphatase 2C domain-containing protein [Thermomicrobiales bacterium]
MTENGRGWQVLGASTLGASHRRQGLPCQDAWMAAECRGEVLAVAVADGAGSASHAQVGARLAARRAVSAVFDRTLQPRTGGVYAMLDDAFLQARRELEFEAAATGLELRDLSTTLTMVIAMPDCLGVAQTGDGLVVALEPDGSLIPLTLPQRGEYANETHFLTGPGGEAPRYIQIGEAAPGFAVLTDGLLPVSADLKTGRPHAPFFEPFFATLRQGSATPDLQRHLFQFLESPRLRERVDDDLTLVVAVHPDDA